MMQHDLDPAAIERSLVLGWARHPIEVPEQWRREDEVRSALGFLSVVATRARFMRPEAPGFVATKPRRVSKDHYPDASVRQCMRRLFSAGDVHAAVALRVSDALHAGGMQVHPFDVPVLSRLFADEDVTHRSEVDWDDATPTERTHIIELVRRDDPARARELCAAEITAQTAAVRNKWLAALEHRLSAEDAVFLESLRNDRAKSVVARAKELLARIPGTEIFETRLADAISRLSLKKSLVRRRPRVVLDVPGHLRAAQRHEWMLSTFGFVSPTTLSTRFELSTEAFVDAIEDRDLRRALYVSSIADSDEASATVLAAGFELSDLQALLYHGETDVTANWDEAQRILAMETIVPFEAFLAPDHGGYAVAELYSRLRRPLSVERSSKLFERSLRGFNDLQEEERVVAAILNWLIVLPRPTRDRLVESTVALGGPHRRSITDFQTILNRIEKRD